MPISCDSPFMVTTLEKGCFRLSCEAGLKECTADPPKDRSATIFKAEARRTRSKKFLIKKFADLCELHASVVNPYLQKTRNNRKRKEERPCSLQKILAR
jgi:hypothetical protein